jgi:hypothetical protein
MEKSGRKRKYSCLDASQRLVNLVDWMNVGKFLVLGSWFLVLGS